MFTIKASVQSVFKIMDKPAGQINVLDRLAYIGDSAMGALSFEPEHDLSNAIDMSKLTLAKLDDCKYTHP